MRHFTNAERLGLGRDNNFLTAVQSGALDVFAKHLPGATVQIAAKSYDTFLNPQTGFDRKAAIDVAGVKTVIDIRQEYAVPHSALVEPPRDDDLSYYDATKH